MQRKIVLASASPRRRELLEGLGLSFSVVPSDAPEEAKAGESPADMVTRLSEVKAKSVLSSTGALVIAADTVVSIDGMILGKPQNKDEAAKMLKTLSGRWHEVYTGLCVAEKEKIVSRFERTRVKFKELTDDEIDLYIASGETMDKAGAYGIQALGALLVEGIDGDYFNVVGLPMCLLGSILTCEFGLNLLAGQNSRPRLD